MCPAHLKLPQIIHYFYTYSSCLNFTPLLAPTLSSSLCSLLFFSHLLGPMFRLLTFHSPHALRSPKRLLNLALKKHPLYTNSAELNELSPHGLTNEGIPFTRETVTRRTYLLHVWGRPSPLLNHSWTNTDLVNEGNTVSDPMLFSFGTKSNYPQTHT